MQTEFRCLQESPSSSSWRNLSKALFVLMTTFNRRRGSEVAKMHLKMFTAMKDNQKEHNQEILESLSPMEKKLLDRFVFF